MNETPEMTNFLAEGLFRYSDARDVVDAFEDEMKERLLRVMEEKCDWRNLIVRAGVRGRNKGGIWADTWSDSRRGRSIFTYQPNADREKCAITLGLWWRSPRFPSSVILYCSCWRGGALRDVALDNPQSPIACAAPDDSKAMLAQPFEATVDLALAGRVMLDDMDRALGQMKIGDCA